MNDLCHKCNFVQKILSLLEQNLKLTILKYIIIKLLRWIFRYLWQNIQTLAIYRRIEIIKSIISVFHTSKL
jgi:hypothetical protein